MFATLVPDPADGITVPMRRVAIPSKIIPIPQHFPKGFPADYPAMVTNLFARDVIALSEDTEETFHIHIDLPEFIDSDYPWLPFTLALHALALTPQSIVFFRGMNPVNYSNLIDSRRPPYRALDCIRNFVSYLCTTKGDRPCRVFGQTPEGSFVSFDHDIMRAYGWTARFSLYYLAWLRNPYRTEAAHDRTVVYVTHPFDHLPVKNLTGQLKRSFLTKAQLKEHGIYNPDIEKAVLMHDQIRTVALRPYWPVPQEHHK